jgi:hypothetical protein
MNLNAMPQNDNENEQNIPSNLFFENLFVRAKDKETGIELNDQEISIINTLDKLDETDSDEYTNGPHSQIIVRDKIFNEYKIIKTKNKEGNENFIIIQLNKRPKLESTKESVPEGTVKKELSLLEKFLRKLGIKTN